MEYPTPIAVDFNENLVHENSNRAIKKEYKLKENNNQYSLNIFIANNYINFKISQINDILYNYYINKFDLNAINNILDLDYEAYNNLEKILELIDNYYNNRKILIKSLSDNEINLIIRCMLGEKENEYIIPLIKMESDINKKFENILNELNSLKSKGLEEIKAKFQKIEKLIIDLKYNVYKKLDDNLNSINILSNKLADNKRCLENNKIEINKLKNDIFNLMHYEMKNKIYEIYIEDNYKGKGFFTKIKDNNHSIKVLITNNNESELREDTKIMIKNNNESREIELKDRIIYSNKEYDITVIEIKKKDNLKNYLELDDNNNDIDNNLYIDKSIYILDDMIYYGKIKEIKEEIFIYECYTENNSKSLPIISLINNKLIGIKQDIHNNVGLFLQYPINDFIIKYSFKYKLTSKYISKINNKYNLNLKDNIQELNLENKKISNERLEFLWKINLMDLKEINLSRNNITNINILEKANFYKIEKIDLSDNKISDINILENANFRKLKELNLSRNNISNIDVLKKAKFTKLEKLGLSANNIVNINIFTNVDFKELKELYLRNNLISNIFEDVSFDKLERLDLSHNKIENISNLKLSDFKFLKELNLRNNNISDIKVLKYVEFYKLEKLDLSYNKIECIDYIIENSYFTELKGLYLVSNNISDIKILQKLKFNNIVILDFEKNKIDENDFFYTIKNLRDKNINIII